MMCPSSCVVTITHQLATSIALNDKYLRHMVSRHFAEIRVTRVSMMGYDTDSVCSVLIDGCHALSIYLHSLPNENAG